MRKLIIGSLSKAVYEGDTVHGSSMSGTNCRYGKAIKPCKEIIETIVAEAQERLNTLKFQQANTHPTEQIATNIKEVFIGMAINRPSVLFKTFTKHLSVILVNFLPAFLHIYGIIMQEVCNEKGNDLYLFTYLLGFF